MSDSYTSSDEEFASADEGEEELVANGSPLYPQEDGSLSSSAIPTLGDIETDGAKEDNNSSPPVSKAAGKEGRPIKLTVPCVEALATEVRILDITDGSSTQIKTEDFKYNEAEPVESTSNSNSSNPVESESSDTIKPRNIGRAPSRDKPSLGAKKLGAVKISETSASLTHHEPTLTAAENNKPMVFEEAPKLLESSSTSQQSNESNSWGWFAPPKLLSSVTSLTTQILSTVENGLNIPEPEELAKEDLALGEAVESDKKATEQSGVSESKGLGFGLFGVSSFTKLVETTSTSLFASGLDTLETIGKKTIDVLQQTDPGFKKTRSALANPLNSQEKVCLSQVLREAKDNSEAKVNRPSSSTPATQTQSLSSLIELHYGASHMEALQMLSQQWSSRIAPQMRRLTSQRRVIFEEIAKICSENIESEDEDCDPDEFDSQHLEQSLTSLLDRVSLIVPSQKLIDAVIEGMLDDEIPEDFYTNALDSLALVTSRVIELFRKSAELLLMMPKPSVTGAKLEAETLRQIADVMIKETTRLGNRHASLIIKNEATKGKHSSTDLFYECANCRSFIQDALKLLIPVIQSRVV